VDKVMEIIKFDAYEFVEIDFSSADWKKLSEIVQYPKGLTGILVIEGTKAKRDFKLTIPMGEGPLMYWSRGAVSYDYKKIQVTSWPAL